MAVDEVGVRAGVGYLEAEGTYSVYTADGKVVKRGVSGRIRLPRGLYFVRYREAIRKVLVR